MSDDIEIIETEARRITTETRPASITAERLGKLLELMADVVRQQDAGTPEQFDNGFSSKAGKLFSNH